MIVDSSALIAILLHEPERDAMVRAMAMAPRRAIGAPNWLETCMVFDGRDAPSPAGSLETLLTRFDLTILPFDSAMAARAHAAFRTYGKGSRHPARLNFGDCMAYALAKQTGEPILFKGDDFIHTDIPPALA